MVSAWPCSRAIGAGGLGAAVLQTMACARVDRSWFHSTVVSRWLVMPTPARIARPNACFGQRRARWRAACARFPVGRATQPGWGDLGQLRWVCATMWRVHRNHERGGELECLVECVRSGVQVAWIRFSYGSSDTGVPHKAGKAQAAVADVGEQAVDLD